MRGKPLPRRLRNFSVAAERYALSLVRQTRVGTPGTPDFVQDMVGWGAGPRAVQFLILGGKARAILRGRTHVSTEDIQSLAKPVLRHRLAGGSDLEGEPLGLQIVVERLPGGAVIGFAAHGDQDRGQPDRQVVLADMVDVNLIIGRVFSF